MRYRSNADYAAEAGHAHRRNENLRNIIIELAAALVRLDRNGYQERLLERTLKEAAITREQVDEFNRERAAKIAAKQIDRG